MNSDVQIKTGFFGTNDAQKKTKTDRPSGPFLPFLQDEFYPADHCFFINYYKRVTFFESVLPYVISWVKRHEKLESSVTTSAKHKTDKLGITKRSN